MCGIFCAINLDSHFTSSYYQKFTELTDRVSHRGPDASGYLALNTFNKSSDKENFNIFLGHRRLSILDLSAIANQPMNDNQIYLIYNGEIFNYIELRDELIEQGVSFKSKSDTEVILKLYEKYGEDSFSKFNGMWAIIIVDMLHDRLVISRDRFSIKPLFSFRKGNEFYFASEIKQLLPLLSSTEINEPHLIHFLHTGLADTDEDTFFSRIKRIKPKFNLVIDLQKKVLTEKQYWNYSIEEIPSAEEIMHRFNSIITDSIKIRLRSDVPIGVLLSGGLDSSSIALLSNDLLLSELHTYSIISNDKKYSEEKYIDIFTSSTGIKNYKLPFTNDNVISHLNDVLLYQDEPFVSFSIIAQYLIFRELKDNSNITVVLSGQGADELLLGYLRYYMFYLRILQKDGEYFKISKEIFFMLLYRTYLSQFRLNVFNRYFKIQQNGTSFIKKVNKYESSWKNDSMRDIQIKDIDQFSIPILTRYEDRNSMSQSLEVRLPFLDHRLVNFLVNLPVNYKLNKGWNKYILRNCMSNLPDKIRWRKDKKGFVTPDEKWLKGELLGDIKNVFSKSILAKMDIIDGEKFNQYYNSYLNGNKLIHNFDISRIYITEKWLRQIFI